MSVQYERISARELKEGDIICPEGIPPGQITKLAYTSAMEELPNYLMYFEYEGDVCGKRTCDIRPDKKVVVYRGKLSDANAAWLAKHPKSMTLAQKILEMINQHKKGNAQFRMPVQWRAEELIEHIEQLCSSEAKGDSEEEANTQ